MDILYFGIEMEILVRPKQKLIDILVNSKQFCWDREVTPASRDETKTAVNRLALHQAVASVLDAAGVPASHGEAVPYSKW
jgi:hypothetical protein